MSVNIEQEKKEVSKMRKQALASKIKNDQYEKGKIWEPIPNAPGNAKRLIK